MAGWSHKLDNSSFSLTCMPRSSTRIVVCVCVSVLFIAMRHPHSRQENQISIDIWWSSTNYTYKVNSLFYTLKKKVKTIITRLLVRFMQFVLKLLPQNYVHFLKLIAFIRFHNEFAGPRNAQIKSRCLWPFWCVAANNLTWES